MKVNKSDRRPKVTIQLPTKSVRKSFSLPEDLCSVLSEYTQFLSAYHAGKISEDSVLQSLLTRLSRDKAFKAWRAQRQA